MGRNYADAEVSSRAPRVARASGRAPGGRTADPAAAGRRGGASRGRGGARSAAGWRSGRPRSGGRRRRRGTRGVARRGSSGPTTGSEPRPCASTDSTTTSPALGARPMPAPARFPTSCRPRSPRICIAVTSRSTRSRSRSEVRRRESSRRRPRRSRTSRPTGYGSCTTGASSTTPRACSGSCGTRAVSGSRSSRTRGRWRTEPWMGARCGTVSGSRIGAELRLLAREPDPVKALRSLGGLGLGLDRAIHPGFGLEDEQLARRALALAPDDTRSDRLVLALAARRIPGRELAALLDSLAFQAEDRDVILAAATRAEDLARSLEAAAAPSAIAAAAAGAPGGAGRARRRARPRAPGPRLARRAPPRSPVDRRRRPACGGGARGPGDRARTARGAGGEARPHRYRARAGARRGAQRRRRARVAWPERSAATRLPDGGSRPRTAGAS